MHLGLFLYPHQVLRHMSDHDPLGYPMVSCDLGGGFVIDRRNDPTQHWGLFKIADVFIRSISRGILAFGISEYRQRNMTVQRLGGPVYGLS